MLRHAAKTIFGADYSLPDMHFILYMVPSDFGYDKHWHYVTGGGIPLSYAFPFPQRFKQDAEVFWSSSMIAAASYLSHETMLALLMDRRTRGHQHFWYRGSTPSNTTHDEFRATLFNLYFAMKFAVSDAQFGAVVIPHITYDFPRDKLDRMDDANRWALVGSQMAGRSLEHTFGVNVPVCGHDKVAMRRYQQLLTRLIQDPMQLEKHKNRAVKSLNESFPGEYLKLHTEHGVIKLLVRADGEQSMDNDSDGFSMGGIYWSPRHTLGMQGAEYRKVRERSHLLQKICF